MHLNKNITIYQKRRDLWIFEKGSPLFSLSWKKDESVRINDLTCAIKVDGKYPGEKVNDGEFFPASYDKPHVFNLLSNWKFSRESIRVLYILALCTYILFRV